MIISKKESKQLRYIARANYKSDVKGDSNGKVKYREFPVYGLCYNESKTPDGMIELTDIQVNYKPFEGTTYNELLDALKEVLESEEIAEKQKIQESTETDTSDCLRDNPDCKVTPIPASPSLVQKVNDTEVVTNPLTDIHVEKTMEIVKNNIEQTITEPPKDVDDSIKVTAETLIKEALPEESKVDVTVTETTQDTATLNISVEPSEVVLPTESKVEPEPVKTLDRGQLLDLRMKCATIRLAGKYYEPPETPIATLMTRYPDASTKLNEIFSSDGVTPYIISEEILKNAYPFEFDFLNNKMVKPQ